MKHDTLIFTPPLEIVLIVKMQYKGKGRDQDLLSDISAICNCWPQLQIKGGGSAASSGRPSRAPARELSRLYMYCYVHWSMIHRKRIVAKHLLPAVVHVTARQCNRRRAISRWRRRSGFGFHFQTTSTSTATRTAGNRFCQSNGCIRMQNIMIFLVGNTTGNVSNYGINQALSCYPLVRNILCVIYFMTSLIKYAWHTK